jgi:hypothetical protein
VNDRPEQIRDRMKRCGWSLACYGTATVCVVEAHHERAGVLVHGRGTTDAAAWKDAAEQARARGLLDADEWGPTS